MTTIAYDGASPGRAKKVDVHAQMDRAAVLVTGAFSFDSSYPTGGEDISDIFSNFTQLLGVLFEQPIQVGAETGKFLRVDYTNKKVQLFTNAQPFVEVANASDQSLIAGLRFIAWGY